MVVDTTHDSTTALPLISVVIPVYNGEQYVEEAVRSALEQPQDIEVILVEDGSTDDSLRVCEGLAAESGRVRLFRHPRGENRGAGASRNLGIRKASGRYVAFLDADDYYLPGRFGRDLEILESDLSVEGVYGAVVTRFEGGHTPMPAGDREITTLDGPIDPSALFAELLLGSRGSFCTDGIIVRRSVFAKTGLFDEQLVLSQDSAMWLKMAATCKLVAGSIEEPVAVRRRHEANRTSVRHPFWPKATCAYVWSVFRWANGRRLNDRIIRQLRHGLALTIVDKRLGVSVVPRLRRILQRTLTYGFRYVPLLYDLGLLLAKKALGRPRVDKNLSSELGRAWSAPRR